MADYAIAIEKQLEMRRFYTRYEQAMAARIDNQPSALGPQFQQSALSLITLRAFREVTESAAPIFYSAEMSKIALAAIDFFDGSESLMPADLPDPDFGFLYSKEPLWRGPSVGGSPYEHVVHGYSWRSASIEVDDGARKTGWLLVEFGNSYPTDGGPPNNDEEIIWSTVWVASESMEENAAFWRDGERLHGWVDERGETRMVAVAAEEFAKRDMELRRRFLALVNFMQQRVVITTSTRPPRAVSRRMPDDWRDKMIQVVDLRAREYVRKDTGEEPSYTLSTRHIRRGHWRRQWYPSLGQHRPRWIDAMVVGPAGAPVKGGVKLYHVHR